MKRNLLLLIMLSACCALGMQATELGKEVTWDRYSLMMDGRRVCPVMGEVHYSRIPANEWQEEVRKMKEGGVTVIATYVFWNHVEEEEGIFRWDGQRNLRGFLEICKEEEMPVILRMGPFCHGEVRNGGIPDWMFEKDARCVTATPYSWAMQRSSTVRSLPRCKVFSGKTADLSWRLSLTMSIGDAVSI